LKDIGHSRHLSLHPLILFLALEGTPRHLALYLSLLIGVIDVMIEVFLVGSKLSEFRPFIYSQPELLLDCERLVIEHRSEARELPEIRHLSGFEEATPFAP